MKVKLLILMLLGILTGDREMQLLELNPKNAVIVGPSQLLQQLKVQMLLRDMDFIIFLSSKFLTVHIHQVDNAKEEIIKLLLILFRRTGEWHF